MRRTGGTVGHGHVDEQCEQIEAWAEQCESVPELRDAINKCAAIDQYLSRTSTEGRARVTATMRRLEVRVGELLGPVLPNGGNSINGSVTTDPLSKDHRREFRLMAENPEVVEEVIAESTDEAPASRRKVTQRLKEAAATHPAPDDNKRSVASVRACEQKLREMAAQG